MASDTMIISGLPGSFPMPVVAHYNGFAGFRHSNQKLICWYEIDQAQVAALISLTIQKCDCGDSFDPILFQ